MVNGVIGSAKSLIWALLLLVLVNFLFGVLVMQLSVEYLETVNPNAELLAYFGTLPRTMLTLLLIRTTLHSHAFADEILMSSMHMWNN